MMTTCLHCTIIQCKDLRELEAKSKSRALDKIEDSVGILPLFLASLLRPALHHFNPGTTEIGDSLTTLESVRARRDCHRNHLASPLKETVNLGHPRGPHGVVAEAGVAEGDETSIAPVDLERALSIMIPIMIPWADGSAYSYYPRRFWVFGFDTILRSIDALVHIVKFYVNYITFVMIIHPKEWR